MKRIVRPFDVGEEHQERVPHEAMFRETLAFEGREKDFCHRVVVGIATRAHRRSHAEQLPPLSEGKRSVLTALVGVLNDVCRATLRSRHVERIEYDGRVQRITHGPDHDASAENIEHHGEREKARRRRHECDVGDPDLIRRGRTEVAVDEIPCQGRLRYGPTRPHWSTTLGDAEAAIRAHQARDPLLTDPIAGLPQILEDARRPVRSVRALVRSPLGHGERHIALCAPASAMPSIHFRTRRTLERSSPLER